MTAYLSWEWKKCAISSSIEELDHFLDQLTLEATRSYNFAVNLTLEPGDALSIVLGENMTPVHFYSSTGSPLVVQAVGTWEGEEDRELVFNYCGSRSEWDLHDTVPIADGREAMRRFLATGQRPDNLTWEG